MKQKIAVFIFFGLITVAFIAVGLFALSSYSDNIAVAAPVTVEATATQSADIRLTEVVGEIWYAPTKPARTPRPTRTPRPETTLRPTRTAAPEKPRTETPEPVEMMEAYVGRGSLNLRTFPDLNAPIVITVPQSTTLFVFARSEDGKWVHVKTKADGIEGWAWRKYVWVYKEDQTFDALPVSTVSFVTLTPTAIVYGEFDWNRDGIVSCADFRYQEEALIAYQRGYRHLPISGDGIVCYNLPRRE